MINPHLISFGVVWMEKKVRFKMRKRMEIGMIIRSIGLP